MKRTLTECCTSGTKVITTANQSRGKFHKEPIRTQIKNNQNAELVNLPNMTGFDFARGWINFLTNNKVFFGKSKCYIR